MNIINEISQLMIGGSLCLMGSVFVIEGSLSLLGYAVFAPMALGGLGLCLSSLKKIFPSIPLLGELNAA
jgi:hypothetical protein